MEPQDIEGRDFFVGLRGYDREEVDAFLAQVAAEHRALREELDLLREGAEVPARDPFEDLGANVTAILRTANESATSITAEAQERADALRVQADEYAEKVRREVDDEVSHIRGSAAADAERTRNAAEADAERLRGEAGADALRIRGEAEEEALRRRAELDAEHARLQAMAVEAQAEAEQILEESRRHAEEVVERAHLEAGRLLREADDRVSAIEAEAYEQGRERARTTVEEAVSRLAEATRRHDDLRSRLSEASDEIQLALMALGEPLADPRQAIDDAVREVVVLESQEG